MSAELKFKPCSPDEYRARERSRVSADNLALRGIYIAMFKLEGSNIAKAPQAIKFPAMVIDTEPAEKRLVPITFDALDDDFNPTAWLDGLLESEGYFLAGEQSLPSGYFIDYNNNAVDQDLQAIVAASRGIELEPSIDVLVEMYMA